MTTHDVPPIEHVEVEPDPDGRPLPASLRDKVTIDVVHDGANVPARFMKPDLSPDEVAEAFFLERDWGACQIASSLASALHLPGYWRINIARALLDFNRFPGITPRFADHMNRFAINQPFADALSHEDKRALLEDYYDVISTETESAIRGRAVKISIHTYDVHNVTETRRPAVSILDRSHGYSHRYEIPGGLFDPLFPSELAEYTCDRILRARLGLTLEEAGIAVANNYPYSLPEGSMEIRSQVWFFFQHLKERFLEAHPLSAEEAEDPKSPANLVWRMLLDTNLRSAHSELLRSYLHMFRRPTARRARFEASRDYYEKLAAFLEANRQSLVVEYKNSIDRPSSIVLEVRKDLVFDFDGKRAVAPRVEDAKMLARVMAQAIDTYFETDRVRKAEALAVRDPRFH